MSHLDTLLTEARLWRDRGNTILLLGILAEVVIDACWPDQPHLNPVLRGRGATRPLIRWRDHVFTWKNSVMCAVGLVTLAGLMLERYEGSTVDDINTEIRLDLTAQAYKTLSSRQIGILSSCLKKAGKGTVYVVPVVFDSGASRYASLLTALLKNAEFDVPPQPPEAPDLASLSVFGTVLFVADVILPPKYGIAIQACFDKADLSLPMTGDPKTFGWLKPWEVAIAVAP